MAKKATAKKVAGLKTAAAKRERGAVSSEMRTVILKAIEESGKSIRSIAINAGVSQPQLSRFVTGERDLLLTAADKVAKSLGLKLVKDASAR